ncbi:MAG: response regulator [Firmicutes bacterium]|nr:response regulator [Bacillota bacterium]
MFKKILIVDDEPWVQEGLVKSLPWDTLGVRVVGAAQDGKTALDIYAKTSPEIVLTDIRMPVMDGLELSEEISKINKDTYVILMSAYDEFEYARKALEVNVKNYILKPFGKEEIVLLLKKACNEIDETKKKTRALEEINLYERKKILETLISGILDNPEEFLAKCAEKGINLFEKKIIMYAGRINIHNKYTSTARNTNENGADNIEEQNIVKLIEEDFPKDFVSIVSFMDRKNLVTGFLGFSHPYDESSVKTFLMDACEKLNKQYNVSVTFGVGSAFDYINRAIESYNEAVTALNYAIICQNIKVLFYGEIPSYKSSIDNNSLFAYKQKIEHILRAGMAEEIKKTVEEMNELVLKSRMLYNLGIKDIMLQFVEIPVRILVEYGYSIEDVFGTKYTVLDYLNQMETLEEFKKWFASFLLSTANLIDSNNYDVRKDMELAKEFIHRNYSKNITLQDVSEKVMLTPCYFSKVFKKEVGMSFIRYLTEIRINKAKELLDDFSLKIYDISYMVGYNNVKHFVSLLKKYLGVSPSEYRKKISWRSQ